MRVTIERLRLWILLAGIVMVLAIVAFLAYARYRVRLFGHDLPQKLGLEIEQSTDGFTVSRSHAGHTQFVLHAAKAVQYKGGGHLVLHDVSILMYDKQGAHANHITGSQFEYDQGTQIARADGAVDILMDEPMASIAAAERAGVLKTPKVPGLNAAGANAVPVAQSVHIKTSGLVFDQKAQTATTDQPLTFEEGESSDSVRGSVQGSARGATYDGQQGSLVLSHDVVLQTQLHATPVTIRAQSASFERDTKQLILIAGLIDYQQSHGTADQATVFFRPDGSADHVLGQGNVHLVTDSGDDIHSSSALAQLDPQSRLKEVRLNGGVLLIAHKVNGQSQGDNGKDNAGKGSAIPQTLHADSDAGVLTFADNQLQHVQLTQAVSVVDAEMALPGDAHGSETRELRATKLDLSLGLENGHARVSNMLASGEATMTIHTIHSSAPQQSTTLKGDQLFATLFDGHAFSSLRGDGHTYLLQSSEGGISQTGSADSLVVNFMPAGAAAGKKEASAAAGDRGAHAAGSQIASAVQQGHATLAQVQPSATPGQPPVKTVASAGRITYDGPSGRIELTGDPGAVGTPRIDQPGSELTAATVVFDRFTGDGSAVGGVKATYTSDAGAGGNAKTPAEALHVVADHATFDHGRDETVFFGGDSPQPAVSQSSRNARLWQGPNSIAAPVLVLSRSRQLLTAKGPGGEVKTAFAEPPANQAGKSSSLAAQPQTGGVFRVTSSLLLYSGGQRKAAFSGDVVAQGAAGTLHSTSLDAYLSQKPSFASASAKANAGAATGLGVGGAVERVVALGHVVLEQGERKGVGDKLVYTAEDGRLVLTGREGSLPRVTDPVHGSVTGATLNFNTRDDTVLVSSANSGPAATATDTRTPK